ncbi:MAG: SGNH/GDSL hydrolase family protein [Planctomycetota bacterium]
MRAWLIGLAVALVSICGVANGQPPYSGMVVFGDSLSDTGNTFAAVGIPPSETYFNGRYSNGPVWIDFLQNNLGLGDESVLNLAVGGSQTGQGLEEPPSGIFETPPGLVLPTVGFQINQYLATTIVDPDQLTIVGGGSNDLLRSKSPFEIAGNVDSHVRQLAAAGADEFLVPAIPPVGSTPLIEGGFQGFLLNLQTWLANRLINQRMDAIEAELGVTIHRLDTFGLGLVGIYVPQLFGFTNTTDAALVDIADGLITPEEGGSYFFWDVLHPTSKTHEILGDTAFLILVL